MKIHGTHVDPDHIPPDVLDVIVDRLHADIHKDGILASPIGDTPSVPLVADPHGNALIWALGKIFGKGGAS